MSIFPIASFPRQLLADEMEAICNTINVRTTIDDALCVYVNIYQMILMHYNNIGRHLVINDMPNFMGGHNDAS